MFELCLRCLDRTIKWLEPFYAVLATTLVICSAYVVITSVITEVRLASGWLAAAGHLLLALWLLLNILFNHMMCIFTSPGYTSQVDMQALQGAQTYGWRWCRKCNRPKPALAHHCSICNQCVLKMDHHCPWMANCVGFYNYHHFYRYLFWTWASTLYGMAVLLQHPHWWHEARSSASRLSSQQHQLHPDAWRSMSTYELLVFIIAVSICIGLTALLGLHTYLVISGQGTIDLVDNYYSAKDAREAGTEFRNLYDLGFAANWRNTFDVSGPLWWLTWALPSIAPKRGNGYVLSVNLGGRPGSSRQHQVALLV